MWTVSTIALYILSSVTYFSSKHVISPFANCMCSSLPSSVMSKSSTFASIFVISSICPSSSVTLHRGALKNLFIVPNKHCTKRNYPPPTVGRVTVQRDVMWYSALHILLDNLFLHILTPHTMTDPILTWLCSIYLFQFSAYIHLKDANFYQTIQVNWDGHTRSITT